MKLFCPLINVVITILLVGIAVLQSLRSRKRTKLYAMYNTAGNGALLVGALFGLCTGSKDIILMSAFMNGAVLIIDGIIEMVTHKVQPAVMHFLLALLVVIGLILYL